MFLLFCMCPIIYLQHVQVFLSICTLLTLYFAKEVPIIASHSHLWSDSAPLLDDPQQNGLELSKSKSNSKGNNINKGIEQNMNPKHGNPNSVENWNKSLDDGPGSVLVNLLTSLRHLPPGMQSVLAVMALTWVSSSPIRVFFQNFKVILSVITCLLIMHIINVFQGIVGIKVEGGKRSVEDEKVTTLLLFG